MTLDKLSADTLDLLAQLRADIADGKVRVTQCHVNCQEYSKDFRYWVMVEEVKEKAT